MASTPVLALTDLITVYYNEDDGPLDKSKGDNFRTAVRIGLAKLRSIVESARAIRPDDNSDAAKAKRRIESYREFDGICFVAQLKRKAAENGYRARNVVDYVIIPGDPDWSPSPTQPSPTTAAVAVSRTYEFDDEIPYRRAVTDALAPIADKLKRFIRLLSSDNDHEALGAARALNRTLKAAKLDIHALADNIGRAQRQKIHRGRRG